MADTNQETNFAFTFLDAKQCNCLEKYKDFLEKWSMSGQLLVQTFSFNCQFQAYLKEKFVLDFMKDPVVLANVKVVSDTGKVSSLGSGIRSHANLNLTLRQPTVLPPMTGVTADSVAVEHIPCSVLSMTYFDRLCEGVVRESGHIQKCLDEFVDDIQISDELRKMLLIDDSDHYCMYDDTEREEFLFRLFQHLCIGGRICQYEDMVDPYLETTKDLYKELVSVEKNPETKKIGITSTVLKVTAKVDGSVFYPSPKEHLQNFSYLIVDPIKRHVTVLYHRFGSMGLF